MTGELAQVFAVLVVAGASYAAGRGLYAAGERALAWMLFGRGRWWSS